MRVLLDENVPQPLHAILGHILPGHQVDHVAQAWPGKKDIPLLRDAGRKYDIFVTNDTNQYHDPDECRAIRESRLHHVTYQLPHEGLDGLALASGALCAALRGIVNELDGVRGQRIVKITSLAKNRKRFTVIDPRTNPPSAYWT